MLSPDGTKTSNEFLVNVPDKPNTKRQRPAIVETPLGFAVAWNEQLPGGVPQLKLRAFDGDTLSGPEIQVSSAQVEPLIRPAMTRLGDGGFVTVWADARADERIRAQRFGLEGEKAGPEFRANTVAGLHRVPMAAALTNGNSSSGGARAYRGRCSSTFRYSTPAAARSGANGQPTSTLRTLPWLAQFRSLRDHAYPPARGRRDRLRHVRPGSERVRGEWRLRRPPVQCDDRPDPDFVARHRAAVRRPLRSGLDRIERRRARCRHERHGEAVLGPRRDRQSRPGQPSTGNERFSLSIAATSGPDGEIVFAVWNDDSQGAGDTSGRAVRGRPLPIPAGGF